MPLVCFEYNNNKVDVKKAQIFASSEAKEVEVDIVLDKDQAILLGIKAED